MDLRFPNDTLVSLIKKCQIGSCHLFCKRSFVKSESFIKTFPFCVTMKRKNILMHENNVLMHENNVMMLNEFALFITMLFSH